MRLLVGPLLCAAFVAPGLLVRARDNTHISAESITYLDGSSWVASSFYRRTDAACSFVQGRDYDEPDSYIDAKSATTSQGCCDLCKQNPSCTAGVWNSDNNFCYMKLAGAFEKSSTPNNWACELQVEPFSIPATVPGDVISDLQRAGVIADPYLDMNFLNSSMWANLWNISTKFTTPSLEANQEIYLVFEGVKMGAEVFVDETHVGTMDDQFLRYSFPLSRVVSPSGGQHTVRVAFSNAIAVHNRFMACTGGWDWAPYTNTFQEGVPTFSKGIWRSVYTVVVSADAPAIAHVKPLVYYLGPYPSAPLVEHQHGGFNVSVTTYLKSPFAARGTLMITSDWGESVCVDVAYDAGEASNDLGITAVLPAHATAVNLWWPNDMGSQPLYRINISYASAADPATAVPRSLQPSQPLSCAARHLLNAQLSGTVQTSRRIGFRFIALVTGNDTDPAYVAKSQKLEGSDTMGMFLRVNGAPLFAKGANMIPMEELEGRMSDESHVTLVQSAAAAHMTMLRVWGGGMYLPDAWYDACDENGILVYHDMQYATGGLHDNGGGPQYTHTQYLEMQHQLRRLSHHASIALWDGCNECDGQGLYAGFVMTVVAAEDTSRPVWPACPSNGWATGVHRLTQLPNGNALFPIENGGDFEHHGPYYHGSGFPAVNGGINGDDKGFSPVSFDPKMPLALPTSAPAIGPQYPSSFTSEFGSSGFSSFESMSGTLSEKYWGVHGGVPADQCTLGFFSTCVGDNPLSQRNYPCDGLVLTFFADQDFDATGKEAFQRQLYLCMLSQALILKQQIELSRSHNSFGNLLWQLGEIWPTGGWGSLEYGPSWGSQGQVPGGRWKISHHILAQSAFTPVTVSCGAGNVCYVRNDLPAAFQGTLNISAINVTTGEVTPVYSNQISVAAGAGSVQWLTLPSVPDSSTSVLQATVQANGKTITNNVIHLVPPKNVSFVDTTLTLSVAGHPNADGSIDVSLSAEPAPAFYVTLTTQAAGRFSSNAIVVLPNAPVTVQFIPFGSLDAAQLRASIRADHLGMYV